VRFFPAAPHLFFFGTYEESNPATGHRAMREPVKKRALVRVFVYVRDAECA
jgi:hypothetical protein